MRAVRAVLLLAWAGCARPTPELSDGAVALTLDDLAPGHLTPLRGEVRWWWRELLPPDAVAAAEASAPPFALPGVWTGLDLDGEVLGADGFATFAWEVRLPEGAPPLGVRSMEQAHAYRLWIDGALALANGTVGVDVDAERPEWRPAWAPVADADGDGVLRMVMQVSNHHHAKGGPRNRIVLGELATVAAADTRAISIDLFLFGSLFVMGVYHLGLFVFRRRDPSTFWFAALCLTIGLRALATGDSFWLARIWPGLPWELHARVDYLTFTLGLLTGVRFVRSLFPEEDLPGLIAATTASSVGFSLVILATSPSFYTTLLAPYQLLTLALWMGALATIARALRAGRDGAAVLAAGSVIWTVTFLNDLAFSHGLVATGWIFPYGMFVLLLSQALVLARRSSRAFDAIEQMTLELRRQSDVLSRQNERLSQLDRLKDEFLANTSHELRTPLNGIIGLGEGLLARDALVGDASQELRLIVRSGRRLAALVNDLIDFSRIRHHGLVLRPVAVDLRALADLVARSLRPLLGRKPVTVRLDIPDDLPPLRADEARLEQILFNLLGNAAKFTHEGEIGLTARAADGQVELVVHDTGVGIPADKHAAIFEAFEQADGSVQREYGGAGLGLSITRQLVHLHGGTIRVDSEPGRGSAFTVRLPAWTGDVPAAPAPVERADLEAEEAPLALAVIPRAEARADVLVVDDEPINLAVLQSALGQQRYHVRTAESGEEALRLIEEAVPDLIVLDLMMPRMSGLEVCQRVRARHPASVLPILMLTAKGAVHDVVAGITTGANDYLTKPFHREELQARVKGHLTLSRIAAAYGRFVPHAFLDLLGKEAITDVRLGDCVRLEMAVLFSDIRGFTTISEAMTPEQNFGFINAYLAHAAPAVAAHGGFIDKYIGDAIMALFPGGPRDAASAALALQAAARRFNAERAEAGEAPVAIGVGVNTGPLMLGTIGADGRWDGTVISDAVNLASRLESLTKTYGAQILLSARSFAALGGDRAGRLIDVIRVKGREDPEPIFELLDDLPPRVRAARLAAAPALATAIQARDAGDLAAYRAALDAAEAQSPADPAIAVHRAAAAVP